MTTILWPDPLHKPEPQRVQVLLAEFWRQLAFLTDLVVAHEHLLIDEATHALRQLVIEMMLALNGIQRPAGTLHLNGYLGESQRAVLEKTLLLPHVSQESWIGRAVALVVIYRWYAPQLVEKFALVYPQVQEDETFALLRSKLPDWPNAITTE